MRISRYLRRWLGLPRSLSSIAIYGSTNKLTLPISSLTEEFKVNRARRVLLYSESHDQKVSQAGIEVRTRRKWRATEVVDKVESRLLHKVLVETVAIGRAGQGSIPSANYKAKGKERQDLVQKEMRAGVKGQRACQMVGLWQQGAWTSEDYLSGAMKGRSILHQVPRLPSPSNLFCWGKVETPACPLCQGRGTLERISSSCSKVLTEGRYRWCHNQVLKSTCSNIEYPSQMPSTSKTHHHSG